MLKPPVRGDDGCGLGDPSASWKTWSIGVESGGERVFMRLVAVVLRPSGADRGDVEDDSGTAERT